MLPGHIDVPVETNTFPLAGVNVDSLKILVITAALSVFPGSVQAHDESGHHSSDGHHSQYHDHGHEGIRRPVGPEAYFPRDPGIFYGARGGRFLADPTGPEGIRYVPPAGGENFSGPGTYMFYYPQPFMLPNGNVIQQGWVYRIINFAPGDPRNLPSPTPTYPGATVAPSSGASTYVPIYKGNTGSKRVRGKR